MKTRTLAYLCGALAAVAPAGATSQAPGLTPHDSALHVLSRLAYGPRPGEVDRVAADGVMRWIDRQLYEVIVDFWANHFNVFFAKGADRFLTPSYIEQTIRPRALGKFPELLIATAQSPAMLFYLHNWESVAPG